MKLREFKLIYIRNLLQLKGLKTLIAIHTDCCCNLSLMGGRLRWIVAKKTGRARNRIRVLKWQDVGH